MKVRIPWLGVIGVFVLVIGLVLGFARWSRAYPGLIILAGCVACGIFVMVNELAATRPDRQVPEAGSRTPGAGEDSPAGSGH